MGEASINDSRREMCRDLADLLAKPEGLRLARRLQSAGLLGARQVEADVAVSEPSPEAEPRPISIWQPREEDGELIFVRPEPLALGDHYAAQRILRPKKAESPRRICFFGESAAAGYLYAPHLTPARVLQDQLRAVAGSEAYEVIDLARTNEMLHSLVSTVQSARQLSPDVLVIFAGNNWNLLETPDVSPYVPSVRARQRYAQALRQAGGVPGPIELAGRELSRKAGLALAQIDRVARAAAIPVILVIPEVNLADWETRQPVVWRPGGDTARWHEVYERAMRSLEEKEWEAAITAAQQMLRLDDGTCPTTYRILARAKMGLGELEQAREACRAEVDSSYYATLCFLAAPQANFMAQEIQRRGARHHGFSRVDLPQVFAQYTGSPLPGRRLFLDYCHLTVEGMKAAMAAVTAEVLRLSGAAGDGVEWSSLVRRLPDPRVAPEVEATARFGAAIHSAHRLLPVGDKAPILEYWCQAALDASAGIEQTMLDFVAARSAPCPAVLTAAQQRNFASPYRLMLQHGWQYDYLDVDVIQAICAVLERREKSVRKVVNRLLLEHHGLRADGVDLAYPPVYHWEPLERFYAEVLEADDLTQRGVYRAPWPVSGFCLLCDASQDVVLDLTARLPIAAGLQGSRSGRVRVAVNGRSVGVMAGCERWTRETLWVKRDCLREGFNKVTLHWPAVAPIGDAALQAAIARLEQGMEADLHPVFGEVFSLRASFR